MKINAVGWLPRARWLAPFVSVAFATMAHADIHIGVGLNLVPPPLYYGPPPAYYSPPPPVYYGPGVIYGQGGWNYGGDDDEDGGWRGDGWRGGDGWAHDRWHGGWGDRGGWHGDR